MIITDRVFKHFTSLPSPKVNKSIARSNHENRIYSSMITSRMQLIPFWIKALDAPLARKGPIIGIKLRAKAASHRCRLIPILLSSNLDQHLTKSSAYTGLLRYSSVIAGIRHVFCFSSMPTNSVFFLDIYIP